MGFGFIHSFLLSWICPLEITASCSVCLNSIEELFSIWFSSCSKNSHLKLLHPEQNPSIEVGNDQHFCLHSQQRRKDELSMEIQTITSVEHLELCIEMGTDVLPLESLKDHYHAESYSYWNKVPRLQCRQPHKSYMHRSVMYMYMYIYILYI